MGTFGAGAGAADGAPLSVTAGAAAAAVDVLATGAVVGSADIFLEKREQGRK